MADSYPERRSAAPAPLPPSMRAMSRCPSSTRCSTARAAPRKSSSTTTSTSGRRRSLPTSAIGTDRAPQLEQLLQRELLRGRVAVAGGDEGPVSLLGRGGVQAVEDFRKEDVVQVRHQHADVVRAPLHQAARYRVGAITELFGRSGNRGAA